MTTLLTNSTNRLKVADPTNSNSIGRDGSVVACASIDGLEEIKNLDVELAIWRRALPPQFQKWLDDLDPSQLPNLRILVHPTELRCAIISCFDDSGMASGEMRNFLINDIEELVRTYARIAKTRLVDVRLERINHNACWKFHRDFIRTRLLTTYRGPSTEWVHPQYAAEALCDQKSFKGPTKDLALFDVAIFKGSSAGSGHGIVHRSPPIEGTGCSRLLLVLNEESITSPTQSCEIVETESN